MKEISLYVLDITQNSVAAGAAGLDLSLTESGGTLTVVLRDDGRGMEPAFLAAVTDPFTTTRTTRKVGLGLPLLRLATEQTGGSLAIESSPGAGTTVTALFRTDSIDCPPLGDMPEAMALLIQGAPHMEIRYTHSRAGETVRFDTREIREILGPNIPLSEPEVALWIRDHLRELEDSLPSAAPGQDENKEWKL